MPAGCGAPAAGGLPRLREKMRPNNLPRASAFQKKPDPKTPSPAAVIQVGYRAGTRSPPPPCHHPARVQGCGDPNPDRRGPQHLSVSLLATPLRWGPGFLQPSVPVEMGSCPKSPSTGALRGMQCREAALDAAPGEPPPQLAAASPSSLEKAACSVVLLENGAASGQRALGVNLQLRASPSVPRSPQPRGPPGQHQAFRAQKLQAPGAACPEQHVALGQPRRALIEALSVLIFNPSCLPHGGHSPQRLVLAPALRDVLGPDTPSRKGPGGGGDTNSCSVALAGSPPPSVGPSTGLGRGGRSWGQARRAGRRSRERGGCGRGCPTAPCKLQQPLPGNVLAGGTRASKQTRAAAVGRRAGSRLPSALSHPRAAACAPPCAAWWRRGSAPRCGARAAAGGSVPIPCRWEGGRSWEPGGQRGSAAGGQGRSSLPPPPAPRRVFRGLSGCLRQCHGAGNLWGHQGAQGLEEKGESMRCASAAPKGAWDRCTVSGRCCQHAHGVAAEEPRGHSSRSVPTSGDPGRRFLEQGFAWNSDAHVVQNSLAPASGAPCKSHLPAQAGMRPGPFPVAPAARGRRPVPQPCRPKGSSKPRDPQAGRGRSSWDTAAQLCQCLRLFWLSQASAQQPSLGGHQRHKSVCSQTKVEAEIQNKPERRKALPPVSFHTSSPGQPFFHPSHHQIQHRSRGRTAPLSPGTWEG